jgi:CheY-like chemotaxis protein
MAKKILIIDDDPDIVKYLTTLFANNGYETCSAAGGLEGEGVLERMKPDLITLDLQMPDEWGPRFYRKMVKNPALQAIPVIVISGLSGGRYSIGNAVAYLAKPFDPDELMRVVKKAIGNAE